jgi:magnesium chelatase subunit H
MRDSAHIPGYRVAIVTLDSHAAGPAARATEDLAGDFPGLTVTVHAAAEWGENPQALETARDAVRHADIVIANLLFLEEHVQAILPDLKARRDACDAMVGVIADPQIVHLTRMGGLDMSKARLGHHAVPEETARVVETVLGFGQEPDDHAAAAAEDPALPARKGTGSAGLVPGHAVLAGGLGRQYRGDGAVPGVALCHDPAWRGGAAAAPIDYPDLGLYHPKLPGTRITTEARPDLPGPKKPAGPRSGC